MKKLTLLTLLAIVVFLGSCGNGKRKKNAKDIISSETNLPTNLADLAMTGGLYKEVKGDNISLKLEILPFNKDKLPKVMQKYEGKLLNGAHWRDKNGEQWLILTETGEIEEKKGKTDTSGHMVEPPSTRAEAHAYFWVKKHDSYVAYRKDQWVEKCGPLDVFASFHKNGFTITDLDKNGLAEITLTYVHYCRSDVSPYDLTLRLIEREKLYEMHGTAELKMGVDKDAFVIKATRKDGNFTKAPAAFKTHIDQIWEKVKVEKL
ncbi:hypothetical protein BKI52_05260 [marine bacterium AO1-C]|nr:hypothetical protein BKI52_05260 [marine bacterium AO1-C]